MIHQKWKLFTKKMWNIHNSIPLTRQEVLPQNNDLKTPKDPMMIVSEYDLSESCLHSSDVSQRILGRNREKTKRSTYCFSGDIVHLMNCINRCSTGAQPFKKKIAQALIFAPQKDDTKSSRCSLEVGNVGNG